MEVIVDNTCIGSVREKCMCNCRVAYGVYDNNDQLLCSIERCVCFCECMDVKFEILTPDGTDTGKTISKLFGGFLKEIFTTNDNFLVEFPDFMDTIPKKLLMICAAMMIGMYYFYVYVYYYIYHIKINHKYTYSEFRHFEKKASADDD